MLAFVILAAGCGRAPAADLAPPVVREGVRVLLEDSLHLVRGRRVGLITNQTGLHTAREPGATDRLTADLLHEHPDIDLVALFAPEHGIRGEARGGEVIADTLDPVTGVPVVSLYGGAFEPDSARLASLDVLLFDIQDVGARYYTYVWTMSLAMEAAGQAGIPFVVLDRPNPIGGVLVQGDVLDPAYATLVGRFAVPMRHGLTPGELARLLVGAFGVEVELHVVPADGWRREMTFAETGLRWVPPSPNMPSVESALSYPGTCLFEGTNLSVGRGTDLPFQQIGAPWIDGQALADALNARSLAGVRFEPVTFRPAAPSDGKYGGEEVHGVRFSVTDATRYDPTRAAVAALVEAHRLAGASWEWRPAHFDRLAGTDHLRLGIDQGLDVADLTAGWDQAIEAFRALRRPFLLYPGGDAP